MFYLTGCIPSRKRRGDKLMDCMRVQKIHGESLPLDGGGQGWG